MEINSKNENSFKKNFNLGILDTADYTNTEKYGGSSSFIKNILPYMNNVNVFIFGIGINGTKPWEKVNLNSKTVYIPIADFKFPSTIPMRIKALYGYTKFCRKIKSYKCDLLYIHSPEICLPFLFSSKTVPVVFHQHGFSNALHSSKYYFGKFKIFRKFFDFAMSAIYKNADWIIAIDPIGLLQSENNNARHKTTLLLNGIDTKKFQPNQYLRNMIRELFSIENDTFIIFNAGRIESQKGIQRIISCGPKLREFGVKFKIFIAGDGTYKPFLEKMAEKSLKKDEIFFLGKIDHKNLVQYYNMADVFILPSQLEGVPMAILESIACGTPVIANSVGGIPLVLKNGENGYLLNNLSNDSIINAVLEIQNKIWDRNSVSNTINYLRSENAVKNLFTIFNKLVSP